MLYSIPPHTALRRERRPRVPRRTTGPTRSGTAWRPRVLPAADVCGPDGVSSLVRATCLAHIASLDEEIRLWLPELGEDALMRVYEERARWGEIVQSLVTNHAKRQEGA